MESVWSQVPVTSLSVLQDSGQVLLVQGQFLMLVSSDSGHTLARLWSQGMALSTPLTGQCPVHPSFTHNFH